MVESTQNLEISNIAMNIKENVFQKRKNYLELQKEQNDILEKENGQKLL